MLCKKLSSKNNTADGWNKCTSHCSQEERWIKGTYNFVVHRGLEEGPWIDKNNADSELENAVYVHKPISWCTYHTIWWLHAVVCSTSSLLSLRKENSLKNCHFYCHFYWCHQFFFFFFPLVKKLQLLEVSCVKCWNCPKFLTYSAVIANEKAPALLPLHDLCNGMGSPVI